MTKRNMTKVLRWARIGGASSIAAVALCATWAVLYLTTDSTAAAAVYGGAGTIAGAGTLTATPIAGAVLVARIRMLWIG